MSLETLVIIALLIAIVSLMVSVVAAVLTRANADQRATKRLDDLRSDRAQMDYLERAYLNANDAQRAALDTALAIIREIAPRTAITTDDAALRLLEDIQKPGPPEGSADA